MAKGADTLAAHQKWNTVNRSVQDNESAVLPPCYDVIVVGAGVAGSALAVTLGKQGRRVLLLERNLSEPDRIVGELLQPGGYHALKELGLADCLENIDAVKVRGYVVFNEGIPIHIPYPTDKRRKKPVPYEGRSFHHGRFVSKLRQRAAQVSTVTVIEATVKSLMYAGGDASAPCIGVVCRKSTRAGNSDDPFFISASSDVLDMEDLEFKAPLTIIADGCFSKFRAEYSRVNPITTSQFMGIILRSCRLPFPEHGHVALGNPSPVLLYQIGTDETRVLVDVPHKCKPVRDGPSWDWEAGNGPKFSDNSMKRWMAEVVVHYLPESAKAPFLEALENDRMRIMPNSYLPPISDIKDGLMLLGDAMNMRHPLTGGGMTVALGDVVLLRRLLSPVAVPSLADHRLVRSQLETFHWRRKDLSSVINVLAGALYLLFSAPDEELAVLREACMEYFQRGGNCVEGPVGLLSGLTRSPLTLIYHFFAVALFGTRASFRSGHGAARSALEAVLVMRKAVVVIGPLLLDELRHGSSALFADALAFPAVAMFLGWAALLVSMVAYT